MKTILQTITVETTLEQLEPLTLAAVNLKDYRHAEDESGTITIDRVSPGKTRNAEHVYRVLRAERFPVSKTRVSVRINLQEFARLIYRNEAAVIDDEQDTGKLRAHHGDTVLKVHTNELPAGKFKRYDTFETFDLNVRSKTGDVISTTVFMRPGSIDLARESLAGSPEKPGNN